uniref:Uncharacterized protein n=1 Tax=Avena sativa TaxID=4498 RepID=A0ACD5V708_AVESA
MWICQKLQKITTKAYLASTLSSKATNSCMVGLMQGLWLTHLQAASSTFIICSSYPVPRSVGSRTSSSFPSAFISCTQLTSSFDEDKTMTGRLPVSSSSRTMPKLYMSPLSVATHPCPYSGGM